MDLARNFLLTDLYQLNMMQAYSAKEAQVGGPGRVDLRKRRWRS